MKEEAKKQIAHDRQMKRLKLAIYILLGISLVVSVFVYIKNIPPPAGKYDDFARCIAASGVTFYGAFWCPHCMAQKAEFGDAEKYLPYVECSLPDESGQTQVCIDHDIQSYPTWVFKDGTTNVGVMSLEDLSTKTGCPLPGEATSSVSSSTSSSTGASSPANASPASAVTSSAAVPQY